jgi:SatD family (SatD)
MVNLKKNYFLLLIDIRNSTALPGKAMNNKMKSLEITLKKLNKEFSTQLSHPLTISYGDEIAGLFYSPKDFYNIIIAIRNVLYPLTGIRFSAVKGKISVQSEDIRKVGGPAFKKASVAINNLKETGRYASWQLGNIIHDKTLESLCEISNTLVNDMSEYQRTVFDFLSAGLTQKQIADQLGKYTQSVWDAVQRSKAVYIIEGQKTINLILGIYK